MSFYVAWQIIVKQIDWVTVIRFVLYQSMCLKQLIILKYSVSIFNIFI